MSTPSRRQASRSLSRTSRELLLRGKYLLVTCSMPSSNPMSFSSHSPHLSTIPACHDVFQLSRCRLRDEILDSRGDREDVAARSTTHKNLLSSLARPFVYDYPFSSGHGCKSKQPSVPQLHRRARLLRVQVPCARTETLGLRDAVDTFLSTPKVRRTWNGMRIRAPRKNMVAAFSATCSYLRPFHL